MLLATLAGVTSNCSIGDAVIAMVRPEQIHIVVALPRDLDTCIQGRTSDSVFTGDKLNLYVDTSLGPVVTALPNRGEEFTAPTAPGEPVTLAWRWDAMVLFPTRG